MADRTAPRPPRGAGGPGRAPRRARPPLLLVVAAVVLLEALGLAAVAVVFVVGVLRAGAYDALGAVGIAALAAVVAGGLVLVARGLLAGRRWSRAPALTWQLLQLVVVLPALRGPAWPVAAVLVACSAVAAVGLFTPAVVGATSGDAPPPVS